MRGPEQTAAKGPAEERGLSPEATPVRVFLAVPGFPLLVGGFRSALASAPEVTVVGALDEAGSPGEDHLAEALAASHPDVVVVDATATDLAGREGASLLERVRAARPAARIVALDRRDGERVEFTLRAGADGVLTRAATSDDVIAAIRSVARGRTWVSPDVVSRMVHAYILRAPGASAEDAWESLGVREREILLLAAVGHTNREIARTVGLGEGTVHHLRATVMEKLGVHDRVELLKYALRRGVVGVADL